MNLAVRYYTRSGNTEKLANAIAAALGIRSENISLPLSEKADILFLGCSYYAFDVDEAVKKFIIENKGNIGKIICFGTSAMLRSIDKPIRKVAKDAGIEVDAEYFHCFGSFGLTHKNKPNDADCMAAATFAKKIAGIK